MLRLGTVLFGLLTLGALSVATATLAEAHGFEFADLHRSFGAGPTPVTVYLHRDGGRVTAGDDDPGQARSGVVRRSGHTSVNVPAFRGTDAQWQQFVGCVENHFKSFAVTVVDERPRGDYIGVWVGGAPSMMGLEPTVGGVAPYTGSVLKNASVFTFQTPHRSTRALCDTAAHEIGHALGLDHSRGCTDVMSYESCGSKAFRDHLAPCGEWSDRACADGDGAQNTWATLAALVGHRPRTRVPSPPPAVQHTPRPVAPQTPVLSARVGPSKANSTFTVTVTASDPDGIKNVDLVWYDRRAWKLRCGESNTRRPFTCMRRGSTYTFRIPVTRGRQKFVVRSTDGTGRVKRTPTYEATFR